MALPDPQTIRATFDTLAKATAAFPHEDVTFCFIGNLMYETDAVGNCFSSNGGTRNWKPAGSVAHPEHWGAVGKIIPDVEVQYPSLVGVPDDTEALQAAMTWCVENTMKLEGDYQKIYGTVAPLFFGRSSVGAATGCPFLTMRSMRIGVVGGTWADDDWVLLFGNSDFATNGSPFTYCDIDRIWVDGGIDGSGANIAKRGVAYSRCTQGHASNVYVVHCSLVLQQIGNNVDGLADVNDCGGSLFTRIYGRQWLFGDPGFSSDWSLVTATGLVYRSDDNTITGSNFGITKIACEVSGFEQGRILHSHFWTSASGESEPDSWALYVHEASAVYFYNCRFDSGALVFKDAFANVRLYDCDHVKYSTDEIRLITTQTTEDLRSFGFIGCNLRSGSNPAVLLTEGAGSWPATLLPILYANTRGNGQPFQIDNRLQGQRLLPLWMNDDGVEVTGTVDATGAVSDPIGRLQAVPRSTTAALEAIGNAINTADKFAGKMVINTTAGTIVTAADATAVGVWLALDGTTAHSPV